MSVDDDDDDDGIRMNECMDLTNPRLVFCPIPGNPWRHPMISL